MRITENREYNSREVYFDSKPSKEVLEALKALKMRWHSQKKCWYGFASEHEIINAATGAGATVTTEGYMGGGAIYGSKSRQHLYGSELSAAIRADLKAAKLPCKTSVKVKTYAGGQSLTVTVKLPVEFYKTFEEYAHDPIEAIYKGIGGRSFLYTNDGQAIHRDSWLALEPDEKEKVATEHLTTLYNVSTFEFESGAQYGRDDNVLTAEGNNLLKTINNIVAQYRYDESNSMVDYFNTNFYYDIRVNQAA